jgi:hypothetical protein
VIADAREATDVVVIANVWGRVAATARAAFPVLALRVAGVDG